MEYDRRIKLRAFEERTTYKNDYRRYVGVIREDIKWKRDTSEPPPARTKPYRKEDHESFTKWRENTHVPFDLLWEPRPIVQTNPRIPPKKKSQEAYEDLERQREEAIRTRPRLFISPAIPLDDVEEKEMKKVVLRHMYTTILRSSQEEVAKYTKPIRRDIFDTSLDRKKDPLKFEPDKNPPLPDGWRHLSKKWDEQQRRATVDPTTQFWLQRPLNIDQYAETQKLVPQELKDEIAHLIETHNLRQAHDMTKPLYTGYRPRLLVGVPLTKTDFPVVHPGLTLAQAIDKRKRGDALTL